jgi:uncharacterized protein with PIN domain
MVVDTSAIAAVLYGEPERRAFIEIIEAADSRRMSVASFVEISIAIESRYGSEGIRDLDRFIGKPGIEVGALSAALEKDATGRRSTTATASLTPSLPCRGSRSSAKEIISRKPMLCWQALRVECPR